MMTESEFLQTLRDRLFPELLSYIGHFLPVWVTYKWEDPTYRKIYTLKKQLARLRQEDADLRQQRHDTLEHCFDPGVLREMLATKDDEDERERIIRRLRAEIVRLNRSFMKSPLCRKIYKIF